MSGVEHFRVKWANQWPALTTWHPIITREVLDEHYAKCMRSARGHPELLAQGEEYEALSYADLEAWEAECRAVDERFDVPALAAAHEATMRARRAAEAAITERPANSTAGVAVKLALWVRYDGQASELGATLDDADEQAGIAAYRDPARLASLPEDLYLEGWS